MNIYEQDLGKTAANFVAAVAGQLRRAQRRGLRRPRGGGPRPAPLHLARDARPLPRASPRRCARSASAAAHGQRDAAQHARDGRGALRACRCSARCSTRSTPGSTPPLHRLQLDHCESAVLITDREFAPIDRRGAAHPARRARPHAGRDRRLRQRIRRRRRARSARTSTRRCSPAHAPLAAARRPGRRVGRDRRSTTPRARPATRRASSPPSRRLPERGLQRRDLDHAALPASTCGRCRCSTATAGASRGRWRRSPAPTSACARSRRRRSSTRSASTRVDHYCGAPIVHNMLIDAPAEHARTASTHKVRGDGRRRGAAGGDDRGHGADRLRHHPRLRPDRDLRPGGGRAQARRSGRDADLSRAGAGCNGRQGVRYALRGGHDGDGPGDDAQVPGRRRDHGRDHVPRQHRR